MISKVIRIALLLAFLLTFQSCLSTKSISTNKKEAKYETYKYKPLKITYPDSLSKSSDAIKFITLSLFENSNLLFAIDDLNFVKIHLDTIGNLQKRIFYNGNSSEIIEFGNINGEKYYKDLSDEKSINNDLVFLIKDAIIERTIPEKYKVINDVKCYEYSTTTGVLATKMIFYLNEDIPVDFFRGTPSKVKGIPYGYTLELTSGITATTELIKTDNPIYTDLLSSQTSRLPEYYDLQKIKQEHNNLIISETTFTKYHRMFLYTQNDTILYDRRLCNAIDEFKLDITHKNLSLSYKDLQYDYIAETKSTVPIYNMGKFNPIVSYGVFKEDHIPRKLLYNHAENNKSYHQIDHHEGWIFELETFSEKCLSDSEMIELLSMDKSSNFLPTKSPKLFSLDNSALHNIPWVRSIIY